MKWSTKTIGIIPVLDHNTELFSVIVYEQTNALKSKEKPGLLEGTHQIQGEKGIQTNTHTHT